MFYLKIKKLLNFNEKSKLFTIPNIYILAQYNGEVRRTTCIWNYYDPEINEAFIWEKNKNVNKVILKICSDNPSYKYETIYEETFEIPFSKVQNYKSSVFDIDAGVTFF